METRSREPCFENILVHGDMRLDDDYYPTLLIVEDDDVGRKRMSRYLNQLKDVVNVVYAKNGKQALEYIVNNKIDVLVIDYNLGDMTAYELLTNPKITTDYRDYFSAIVVTGQDGIAGAVEAIKAGVVDYILKDQLTEKALNDTLHNVFSMQKLRRQLRRAHEELEKRSLYDSLTGLANRDLTFDYIQKAIFQAKHAEQTFYLMLMNLNGFKDINDTMGHVNGDEVLRQISQRMLDIVRKSDMVGRLGSDEFICVVQDLEDRKNFDCVLNEFNRAFQMPVMIEGRSIDVGAAIGIAQYPKDGKDIYALMSSADHAMYRAKKANQVYAYSSNQLRRNSNVNGIQLSLALENNLFFVNYQPKIDLFSQKIIGVEALVRLNDEKSNITLFPDDFIRVAERCNLIDRITDEVIEQVVVQNQLWQAKGICLPVSINISARLLDAPEWVEKIMNKFECLQANPQDYIFEITETAIASSSHNALATLHKLIEYGFKISIDDFGAGFTSFKFIHDVDVYEIKIDKMFVEALKPKSRGLEIIKSIVSLANNLGIHVIAEGVETLEQSCLIKEADCHFAQGFLYSGALSGEDFESFYGRYS